MRKKTTKQTEFSVKINDIIDLLKAPQNELILTDEQIQQLTLEEVEQRHLYLEQILANVLDYDIVISDTNIWLELLVGHTSNHSDPRVNARLQFERQLEFISKMMKYRGGKFIMMGETYEEIDRFASMQDPQDHKEADWTDNIVCLNAAARLAKRLILSEQRENRLKIEGICAESHHAAFADPAIVRRVVELFAEGKKVLLLTNDASVAIRSIGLCDDLQRYNNISDKEWNEKHVSLRPMVFTFDDLKILDFYTRQYYYIQMASGQPWMHAIPQQMERQEVPAMQLNLDVFRPGDKHRGDNLFSDQEKQIIQQKQKQQAKAQEKQQPKQEQKQQAKAQEKQQPKQEPKQQPKKENKPQLKKEQKQKKTETKNAEQESEVKSEPKPAKKPRRRPQRSKKASNGDETQLPGTPEVPKAE